MELDAAVGGEQRPPRGGAPPAWLAELTIGPATRAEYGQVAGVLARGMRDNPIHVAAIGADPRRRERTLRRLFGALLEALAWPVLVARRPDGTIVGVCGMPPPGACQPTGRQRLRALRHLPAVLATGPRAAVRVARWQATWAARDPAERHWHLGPVAVDAGLQGLGIGSRLLEQFCARVDTTGEAAYLETDKPINVRFYDRFGFAVIGQQEVLGTPNWFMRRPPRSAEVGPRS